MGPAEIDRPCKICKNPKSLSRHSKFIDRKITSHYCSSKCRNIGEGTNHKLYGILWLMLMLISLVSIGSTLGWELKEFFLAFLFVGSPGYYYIFMGITTNKQSRDFKLHTSMFGQGPSPLTSASIPYHTGELAPTGSYVPNVHVKEINEYILVCCYQAARYGNDNYCMCGRVISQKLKEIFVK